MKKIFLLDLDDSLADSIFGDCKVGHKTTFFLLESILFPCFAWLL